MDLKFPKRSTIGAEIGLNFVRNDRYKTNYISIYFVTELNKKSASYNTLLARVLSRGCEKYPTQQDLNRALDSLFDASLDSDTAKIGEWHTLNLSLCLLDDSFAFPGEGVTEKGIALLKEVLLHPYLPEGSFDPRYVEGERRLNLDEIAAAVNHKARYARSRMFEHMCRLEPYSTCPLGDRRELRAITPESLTAYHRELLATARIEIFCVGRFDEETVTREMRSAFASISRHPKALPAISVRTKARSLKEVTETMDITQANLVIGFRTACTMQDDCWRAMSLYNAVLGGSLTSKLFTVLREKLSLCYSVSSSPDALKGVMLIYAGIAPENRSVAIKEAFGQMEQIRLGNVTEEEMESARGALIHSLNGLEDNPAVLAEWYLPRVLLDKVCTPAQIVEELKRVTLDDVVAVAQNITADTIYTLTSKEVAQ